MTPIYYCGNQGGPFNGDDLKKNLKKYILRKIIGPNHGSYIFIVSARLSIKSARFIGLVGRAGTGPPAAPTCADG